MLAAEYPQAGIDAAVRDFAAVAGEANAQLLADFLAQALQPQPSEGDGTVPEGAVAPAAGADTEGAALGSVIPEATVAVASAGAGGAGASGSGPAGAGGVVTVGKDQKPFIRVQRNLLLQPISDKVRAYGCRYSPRLAETSGAAPHL